MRTRVLVWAAGFTVAAGAIAWGVLTDAATVRLQRSLTSIEAAEEQIPYVGTRIMGAHDAVKLKIWSRDGHKRVDFLGFQNAARPAARSVAPRAPFLGGVPLFLRPGHEQWKRRIKNVALAVRNYDVEVTGHEVVAGRECEIVEIRPRHPGRPGYRVAADVANRFPLRFEVISNGEAVFETHFAEIEYHPAFPAGTFEERRRPQWLTVSQEEVAADRVADAAGFPVMRPNSLPKGFELRGSEVIRVRAEVSKELRDAVQPFLPFPVPKIDASVVHFTYTDGLAAVAVVECSASSELWQHLRKILPPPAPGAGNEVVARKFSDRGGTAYLLEHEGTVVLAAGNVSADQIESMIRTLERR